MQDIIWKCVFFDALTPYELYEILKLRNEVFVVEQNCVFQDADDKDQQCYHLMGFAGNELAAYARLVPPGVSYAFISIGRVVTSAKFRRCGAGKRLMQQAIDTCFSLFGIQKIKIGAQLYLKNFYEGFGFRQHSEMYLEDDIPHIEMLRE
ncbi:MAG: family N-acetyltransferase [Segetibacter sp.]|jgi:ElaA protein|nr:family N-acetyltransferase [Segetibacter sp.]